MDESFDHFEHYRRHYPVMAEYIRRGNIRTERDAGMLHTFFSPCNVPEGLTEEYIRICLKLHPIRVKQKEIHSKKYDLHITLTDSRRMAIVRELAYTLLDQRVEIDPEEFEKRVDAIEAELPALPDLTTQLPTSFPPTLPRELLQSPMTSESFQVGMSKFIEVALKK
jgi:hypothetical protein